MGQRPQDPPRPWHEPLPSRRQGHPNAQPQGCQPLPRQEEPPKASMDHPLPTQEQEGYQPGSFCETTCRRNVKATKAVGGLSYTEILNKKLQKPEIRQKQRENAIRAAKDKKKASEA